MPSLDQERVRLERFVVEGFRSCRHTDLSPTGDLSTLIGINGSGKSNLLQAVFLLRRIAGGRWREREIPEAAICSIKARYRIGKVPVNYRAQLTYSPDERGKEEINSARELWNFSDGKYPRRWIHLPSRFIVRSTSLSSPSSLTNQQTHALNFARINFYIRRGYAGRGGVDARASSLIAKVSAFNSGITYYSASQFTNPASCPNYIEIESDGTLRETYLSPEPHKRFLFALYTSHSKTKNLYEQFLSIVGRRGIGLIDAIHWREIRALSRDVTVRAGGKVVRRKREGLLVIPTIMIKGQRFSPDQLSEGTFKSLALLFYLLSDQSHLMLLEEPEVCVHHGLLTSILEVIKSASARKQILFSTHSEFVLDAVEPEQVHLVRNLASKGTVVQRLPRALSGRNYRALKHYLNTSGNLGEYLRHGGIGK